MSQKKRYLLREDKYSRAYKKAGGAAVLYGKRGEKVTLIGDHGDVMIVEAENGTRFPVRTEQLIEANN